MKSGTSPPHVDKAKATYMDTSACRRSSPRPATVSVSSSASCPPRSLRSRQGPASPRQPRTGAGDDEQPAGAGIMHAGHCPPCLLQGREGRAVDRLQHMHAARIASLIRRKRRSRQSTPYSRRLLLACSSSLVNTLGTAEHSHNLYLEVLAC